MGSRSANAIYFCHTAHTSHTHPPQTTGKSPFEVIYMHGLVRDGQGQKMSKTKGNVIDPIETIDKCVFWGG